MRRVVVLPSWVLCAVAVSFLFLGLVSLDAVARNTSSRVGHLPCDLALGLSCSYDTKRVSADFPAVSIGKPVASISYAYDASAVARALAGMASSPEGVLFEAVADRDGISSAVEAIPRAATTTSPRTYTPRRLGSYANWGDEISDGARVVDQLFGSRGVAPDFVDGTRSPGAGFEWRGTGSPVSRQGNWYNPRTGESLHPDLGHPGPIGPHYDYKAPDGTWYRIFQDGRMEPK